MNTTVRWITTIITFYFTFVVVVSAVGALIVVFSEGLDGLSLEGCKTLLYNAAAMVYFEHISKVLQDNKE